MKDENSFGPHLMLDLHKCNKDKLTDFELVYNFLKDMPGNIGMTRISEPALLKYKDKWAQTPGVTGFVILAESHVSIHTFPDDDFAFIDIFPCRNFNYDRVGKYIIDFFECENPKVNMVKRGEDFNKRPALPEMKIPIRA